MNWINKVIKFCLLVTVSYELFKNREFSQLDFVLLFVILIIGAINSYFIFKKRNNEKAKEKPSINTD